MPEFPSGLALCRTGYSRNLLGEQIRTESDSHTRCRRNSRRRGVTDTVSWICTEPQYQALARFHRQIGSDWFQMELPDWQGITTTTTRFDSPLTITPVQRFFEITASLYIPQPDRIPEEALETWQLKLIGVIDDTFGLPLYFWVNINWGVLWNTGIKDSTFSEPLNTFVQTVWAQYWRPL